MARVLFTGSMMRLTDGEAEVELEAKNIMQLFKGLAERYPALASQIETGYAVAIDGEVFEDALFQPIPSDAEIQLLPKIEGG